MLRQFYISVENLLFPQYCVKCSVNISDNDIFICPVCIKQFSKSGLGNWVNELTCNDQLDFAFSPFWFDELLNQCIHRAKYNHSKRLLKSIALSTKDILYPLLATYHIEALIPVPLHHVKRRERGYNQSDIIAFGFSQFLKIPVDTKTLKRSKWTNSQTKLNTHERNENIKHAFQLKGELPFKRVAIIDDVLTTGSTTSECARILKQGGAEFVGAISLATPKMRLENQD